MKWLGVQHATVILAARFASDKHRLIKYAPKTRPCLLETKDMKIRLKRNIFTVVFFALVLSLAAAAPFMTRVSADGKKNDAKSKITYPETKTVDHVDDYFGTKVPDPYRWLEDETSAETKAWIEAQNRVTFGYLEKIPYREKLKARLTQLFN